MATLIELGIIVREGSFPAITVQNRDDAKELTRLLTRIGVAVNLREVADEIPKPPFHCTNAGHRGCEYILETRGWVLVHHPLSIEPSE